MTTYVIYPAGFVNDKNVFRLILITELKPGRRAKKEKLSSIRYIYIVSVFSRIAREFYCYTNTTGGAYILAGRQYIVTRYGKYERVRCCNENALQFAGRKKWKRVDGVTYKIEVWCSRPTNGDDEKRYGNREFVSNAVRTCCRVYG